MTNIYGWVAAATIVLGFFLRCALRPSLVDSAGHSVPPGPLLRYAFLRKYSERALDNWAKRYGPLYSLWMGNQLFIILSDARVAKEFFYTHGAIFSSRKNYFIKNQTILNGRAITASPYGQTWRDHRKIAMQVLNTNAVSDRSPLMEFEAWDLVHGIFMATQGGTTPVDPVHLIGKYALNNMLSVTFGFRAGLEDPLVEQALAIAMEFMELTGVLANAVDFVPILQYIPTRTHSRAKKVHDELVRVYGAMILRVKEQMASAPADVPDCLVKRLLEENMITGHVIQGKAEEKEGELDWEDACMVSAAFTLGGLHSTAGIIMWFLSLIPSHPEVQARAREELDRVVGSERWSIPDEERNLPYVRAVAKELERMHAPFWVPTAHYSTADFVYQGMYIPKGTAVVLNNYTIHHNDKRYPDPHTFNPDRYLGDDLTCAESARLPALERDHWTFGAGRRLCPGISIAEKEIWLAISRILWAFTVEPIPGEPISLEEYEGEFGRSPLPFRVRFLPREGLESAFEDRKN